MVMEVMSSDAAGMINKVRMCAWGEAGGQEQELAQSGMPGLLFLPSPGLEESPLSV